MEFDAVSELPRLGTASHWIKQTEIRKEPRHSRAIPEAET